MEEQVCGIRSSNVETILFIFIDVPGLHQEREASLSATYSAKSCERRERGREKIERMGREREIP